MVGPMDGMNLLNASRVNATCRSDGTILKPDAPLRSSDECFVTGEDPAACFLYRAHSDVKGLGRVHYLFSNDARPITPRMVDLTNASRTLASHLLVDWYAKKATPLLASQV